MRPENDIPLSKLQPWAQSVDTTARGSSLRRPPERAVWTLIAIICGGEAQVVREVDCFELGC